MTSYRSCHRRALPLGFSLGVIVLAQPLRAQPEGAPETPATLAPQAAPVENAPTAGESTPPEPPSGSASTRGDAPALAPSQPTTASTPSSEAEPVPQADAPAQTDDEPTPPNESGSQGASAPNDAADSANHLRYELEGIEIRGNVRTRSQVILRYLPFRPGKQLDVDDPEFTLARYRLLGTGFFRDVEFSLRKGHVRGKVVLVVDVTERNTAILNGFWFGISADTNSSGKERPLTAFAGVDAAETNLGGTGINLGGAVGIALGQYALHVRFVDPGFMGSPWMVTGTLLHNKAIDFFGFGNVNFTPGKSTNQLNNASSAVLPYSRFGGSVGLGRDLSVSTQLWLHYRLETIHADVPSFASQDGRGKVEPILFDIHDGRSIFSAVRANFQVDTRDHPVLPRLGWFVSTWGELGLAPLGSHYDYQRFDVSASKWWPVPGTRHVFRLQAFAGAMTGTVPFFEQYYVGDFCDFLPSRMLGLNVDSRPANDFLGTAIATVRYGQYAAQLASEYRIPVYRGHRSVYGIDFFLRGGLFSVAHRRDLFDPGPKYDGLERFPLGLTGNFGVRMDTSSGGFVFSFSNVLGFVPMRSGS